MLYILYFEKKISIFDVKCDPIWEIRNSEFSQFLFYYEVFSLLLLQILISKITGIVSKKSYTSFDFTNMFSRVLPTTD